MNLKDKVENELYSYDFEILDTVDVGEGIFTFLTEDFIITTIEKENKINIAFSADTYPETAANTILIFSGIVPTNNFNILESFIFNKRHELVSGEDAHKLLKEHIQTKAIREYRDNKAFDEIMMYHNNCLEC